MTKNSRHTTEIVSVTAKGFGIGYINELAVFVEGGLPGDVLSVHILKVKAKYAYGKILDIIKPSPSRIKSPCPVSDSCGGCQWQHCDYGAQLGFKKQIVIDALERIGGINNPSVEAVIGMKSPERYRNKAVFPIVPSDNKDGFAIGMFAPRSHRIIEVEDCAIQHEAHVNVLKILKSHMRVCKITPYDEITHKGLMRHVIVRVSFATGEIMAVLVINGKRLSDENILIERLAAAGVSTVLINRHEARSNTVMGQELRTVYGTGFITERVGDTEYRLSAPSFFQVNPAQTKILYDTALELAALDGSQNIIDAHAGVGGIALYAAKYTKKVIGVDIVPSAVSDAHKNAALNGINNATFILGTAEEVIPALLDAKHSTQAVFLDPPRKGCEPELLNALTEAKIPKIIYISCDPATLARDVKKLSDYKLCAVRPVDMFPMTGKVEVVVLLERD